MKLNTSSWPIFVFIVTIYPRTIHGGGLSNFKSKKTNNDKVRKADGAYPTTVEETKPAQTNSAAKSGSQPAINAQPIPKVTTSSDRQTHSAATGSDQTPKAPTGSQPQKNLPESYLSGTSSSPAHHASPSTPGAGQTASDRQGAKQPSVQSGGANTAHSPKQPAPSPTSASSSQPQKTTVPAKVSPLGTVEGLTSPQDTSGCAPENNEEPKSKKLKVLEDAMQQVEKAKKQVEGARQKVEATVMEVEEALKNVAETKSAGTGTFDPDGFDFADDDDDDPNTVVEALEKMQKVLRVLAEEVQNAQYETRRKITEAMVLKVKMRAEAVLEALKKVIEEKKSETIKDKAPEGTEVVNKTEQPTEQDNAEDEEEDNENNNECLNTPKEPKVITEANRVLKNLKAAKDALAKEEAYWRTKKIIANDTEEENKEAEAAIKKADAAKNMDEVLKKLEQALYKALDDFNKAGSNITNALDPHNMGGEIILKVDNIVKTATSHQSDMKSLIEGPYTSGTSSGLASGAHATETRQTHRPTRPACTTKLSPDVSDTYKLTPTTADSGSLSGTPINQTVNVSGASSTGKVRPTSGGSIETTATAVKQTGETRKEETGLQGAATTHGSERGESATGPCGSQIETRAGSIPPASGSSRQAVPSYRAPTQSASTAQANAQPVSSSQASGGQPAGRTMASAGTATAGQPKQQLTVSPTAGTSQPAKNPNAAPQPAKGSATATPPSRPANNGQAGRQPSPSATPADSQRTNATTASSTNPKKK